MSGVGRRKRITDPLDDRVKARIIGRDRREPVYISSGSEHSGESYDDDVSPSLSDLVHGFLEKDFGAQASENIDSDSDGDVPMYDSTDVMQDLIKPIVLCNVDSFQNLLAAHVSKAMEVFSSLKLNKPMFRRNVMAFLRNFGYNAGVCKAKWESSVGLAAGNYEFIDVLRSDSSNSRITRYFIDLDFVGEFQIARPTNQYEILLSSLPRVYIGKSEELKKILRVMSDAGRRSLKSKELYFPPWRKNRYMQNKWLGPYRRTVNVFPANTAEKPTAVKCRLVGFNAATDGNLAFPVTARTRR